MAKTPVKPGTEIRNEIATVERDIDIFSGWITRLENPDRVLRDESGGRGVRLYEDLFQDWQVFGQHQVRALSLQACEWQVTPASEKRADVKVAEFVESVFKSANFDALCKSLMQAVITGYKPVEVMWEVSEGDVWVSEFRGRRPSRFVFDLEGRPRLLTPDSVYDGIAVPERKFVVWSYGGHDWNPYGSGLGRQLYWPVWFKKNGIRFWMVFAEKFGSPTVVAKYPPGTSTEDQKKLLEAIQTIQQQTGIRIPETMDIKLLEAARTTSINTYGDLCRFMDAAISKVLVGQTLTSEPGESGSYSLGQVHEDVLRAITKADADDQCECLNNTIVRWIVDFNFPVSGRDAYPKVWRRTEPEEDLKALAERDRILLVDMGLASRVPETYAEETYNLPLAKPGEATIGEASAKVRETNASGPGGQAIPESPSAPAGQFAEPVTAPERAARSQAELEAMMEAASRSASSEMESLLAPLLALVDSSDSLGAIGEKLYDLYPTLDPSRFQEILARAFFAAALKGSAAASDEMEADDAS